MMKSGDIGENVGEVVNPTWGWTCVVAINFEPQQGESH